MLFGVFLAILVKTPLTSTKGTERQKNKNRCLLPDKDDTTTKMVTEQNIL